jgi:hypothetical protein
MAKVVIDADVIVSAVFGGNPMPNPHPAGICRGSLGNKHVRPQAWLSIPFNPITQLQFLSV